MRIEDKFLDKLTFYRIKQTIFNHEDTPWRFIKDVSGLGKERDCYCLLYTSPSPRDGLLSRMPSSA